MKALYTFPFLPLACLISHAQIIRPEQDCIGAIAVCDPVIVQPSTYVGPGMIEDLKEGTSCLGNEENNSAWYVFEIADSGTLEFTIAHMGDSDDTIDYDFSLFDITGAACADIYNGGLEVRCNYSFTDSVTGLRTGYTMNSVGTSNGPYFCAPLAVTPGQKFALLVDNFQTSPVGYVLDFSNSTANFRLNRKLEERVTAVCENNTIRVQFNSSIPCNLLSKDYFIVRGPSPIMVDNITGNNCDSLGYTNYLLFECSGSFIPDSFYHLIFLANSVPATSYCSFTADTFLFQYKDSSWHAIADFIFEINESRVQFSDRSLGDITGYYWSFGDGDYSFLPAPIHRYRFLDTYTACHVVAGVCENDTICKYVTIGYTDILEAINTSNFHIHPNPSSGSLTLNADLIPSASVMVDVFDVFGKKVFNQRMQFMDNRFDLDLEDLVAGIYFITLSTDYFSVTRRFAIIR